MRIVQVSAHYPPELVSGGTLQPQRISRELRRRGHDVQVLAGSLDSTRPPLTTWTEEDETGLQIRWVSTGSFVWWDDVRNYDNPGVRDLSRALYEERRPDVVHCHSLQTLGVGPIEAAADLGIPVVVTMHDFWWICARQFMVDTEHRPCGLVVSASDCPCEAGREHLERRTRRLTEALDLAQAVLVPSAIAARVLVANGVDPSRVAVDENGLPEIDVAPRQVPAGARRPLVARYTGGSNPMKGADVLLDAVSEVGALTNVRVVAHGIDEALERRGTSADAVGIEALPPYAPQELAAVLHDTDVLLLPSVMLETFSIVSREAFAHGVPVVTSDVLGPEEIVEDGLNGAVIRAGDATALAEVLEALDGAPEIVERWGGAVSSTGLRSVAQQVDGLLERYEAVARAPRPRPDPPAQVSVLFVVGIDGAPLRYRAHLPAEALRHVGSRAVVRHYLDPDVDELASGATHVVVYRVPATPLVLEQIAGWRRSGTPVAFDADDLIFDPDLRDEIPALRLLPEDEAALWLQGVERYRTTMEACDAFIGSTPRLVEQAAAVTGLPSFLFENGVGQAIGALSDRALRRPRRPGPPRVGYLSGTTTHDDDWRSVEPAMLELLDRNPDAELWLGGHLTVEDRLRGRLGGRLHLIPFSPWTELPEVLRDLDVNLAPLAPGSRFNDAKSAIKWLEAALCETPTVASPTGPFARAIQDGKTGFLAANDDEWTSAVERLLRDEALRSRMGRAAKRAAVLELSPARQGRRYLEVLDAVARAREPDRRSTWPPVVVDERPARHPIPLEPYPPPLDARAATPARVAHQRTRPSRVRRIILDLRESWQAEGAVATARRAAAALARRLRR